MKKWTHNEMRFDELPIDIQASAKSILKAYNEVNIVFENGKYNVSSSSSVTATYAADHKFIGVYYADDVFTTDELIVNYAESFHDFSPRYKGPRDYKMMNDAGYDWSIKFKIEDGKLIRV